MSSEKLDHLIHSSSCRKTRSHTSFEANSFGTDQARMVTSKLTEKIASRDRIAFFASLFCKAEALQPAEDLVPLFFILGVLYPLAYALVKRNPTDKPDGFIFTTFFLAPIEPRSRGNRHQPNGSLALQTSFTRPPHHRF